MSITLVATLRVVHILAGSFWLGVMLFNAGFLLPATQATGPAGGQVMKQIVHVRRLPLFLNVAVLIVLVTGVVLFWWVSSGLVNAWLSTATGISLSIGGLLTLAAALLGQLVNAPTARRFGQLAASVQAAGKPPGDEVIAEMKRLQLRLLRATWMAAVLLIVATATMAVARYL